MMCNLQTERILSREEVLKVGVVRSLCECLDDPMVLIIAASPPSLEDLYPPPKERSPDDS